MSMSNRPTGTVPKVKSRPNVSSRELDQRCAAISNMPNNLQPSTLEWQPAPQPTSSHSRTRKPRNTRQPLPDLYDLSLDGHTPRDRLRPRMTEMPMRSPQCDSTMENERGTGDYESDSRRSSAETSQSRGQDQTHNSLLGTKNNISRIPDRNQVLSRLNQIRDYVKQTSALMDSLRQSTDPRHMLQAVKLGRMKADLEESESRLVRLLTTLNTLAEIPVPPENSESLENGTNHEHLERFSQLLEIVKAQEDTCLGLYKDGVFPDTAGSPSAHQPIPQRTRTESSSTPEMLSLSRSRSTSEEPCSMPTAAQYAKHQELKLKVEESQKKLQALQEHQSALVALQQKAQEQLREAQAQQGALLSRPDDESPGGNVDNINHRMQTLQDIFSNRNEVVQMLGEQDEELEAEHSALQERLQELQGRKHAMERLVYDLQVLSTVGAMGNIREQKEMKPAESSEEEVESEVLDKREELNRMKARLAQLQSMVSAVHRGDLPHETVRAALTSSDLAAFTEEEEELSASLRRTNGRSSSKPDNINLSNESTPSSLDTQMREIQEKAQELDKAKRRLKQLQELLGTVGMAEEDLDEPEELNESGISQQQMSLDAVQALTSDVHLQTLSLQAERDRLSSLQREVAKMTQPQTSAGPTPSRQAPQPKDKNRNTNQRRLPPEPLKEGPTERQLALQAELQAKRQELEELMRKDQGQSSLVNQDTCSEAGCSLPEISATWGGSTTSQTAHMAAVDQDADGQIQSALCSSDEAPEESIMDRGHSTPRASAVRRKHPSGHPPLPPNAGPSQPTWHGPRPNSQDAWRKDSAGKPGPPSSYDSRATTPRSGLPWLRPGTSPACGPDTMGPPYDLPGSIGSSGATPRPMSDAGSTNTQPPLSSLPWWPMQVQQQLEATSAMCQAMLQQWQWGAQAPEPWWGMQGMQGMQGPLPGPMQQQQLVLTLSQCCHMLWMQHRELATLQATVQALQERIACAERCGLASAATADIGQANGAAAHHQPLKISLSTGVFPSSPADQAIPGVSSAHSLPNLCDGPLTLPPASSLSPSPYVLPPQQTPHDPWMNPHPSTSVGPPPQPPSLPPLLRHPPVTLNNQVPPGIRANNYWDNFRSYSRQNLLSASTKTNEGHTHNPSPLADRSHNSLRPAVEEPQRVPTSSTVNVAQPAYRSRKQKLNTEQRPLQSGSQANPPLSSSSSPARHSPATSQTRHAYLLPSPSSSQPRPAAMPAQEQLYAELAALVAQNESRPDFLPQLFQELQSLSCDTHCQRALQSIREISHTARGDSRNSDHASQVRPRSRESLASFSDDKQQQQQQAESAVSQGTPPVSRSDLHHPYTQPLLDEAAGSEGSIGSQDGATSLPLPSSRKASPLQRGAHSLESCNFELMQGAAIGSHGQLDAEIKGLLLQLLPFLKAHREDCCTPALLEVVRQRTLQLVPPLAAGLNGFIQGQLDALLEDSLLKFQGCWLRDVGEELLATIAEVLLNELTFFKLLDTVSRPVTAAHPTAEPAPASELEEPCQHSGPSETPAVEDLDPPYLQLGTMEQSGAELSGVGPGPQRNCWLTPRMRDAAAAAAAGWDARQDVTLDAEAMLGCNGDLAEADQSHEDARIAEASGTGGGPTTSATDSLADGLMSGRNSRAEGISADASSSDVAEDEMDKLEDLGAVALSDSLSPTEEEVWQVEQDRELDQVPTRLQPGGAAPQQPPTSPTSPPPPASQQSGQGGPPSSSSSLPRP